MLQIDLHTHTTFSDGTMTPEELISYALKKKLAAIAITDHDTLNGIKNKKKYTENKDLEVINGIEMATEYNNKEIHILGLFIDENNPDLKKALDYLIIRREKRNRLMLQKLNNLGISITYDELINVSNNKIITRAHFSKLLIEKGFASTLHECFEKYLSEGKPAYVKREVISPKETVSLIKNAGGIAILAHPYQYKFSDTELEEMIKYFTELGISGIEIIYPTYTKEQQEKLYKLAEKYKLNPSGGSDFHGDNKPKLDLAVGYGDLFVPYSILENLKRGVQNV